MRRNNGLAAGLVLTLVSAVGIGGGVLGAQAAEPATTPEQEALSFGVAIHGDPTGSFWDVVTRGAEDAASTLGVEVTVRGSLDVAEQARFVEEFVTQGVDGLAVSLANPEGMTDALNSAVEAGIPLVTLNSGVDVFRDFGAITHVGQTETIAGEGAGERLNEAGLTKVLCVIHEEGNIGLDQRCEGLENTFGGEVERFSVASTGVNDVAGTLATIQDKVTSDDTIDGVLTLNPDVGVAARDAIAAAGSDVALATFDLNPEVLGAIEDGEILFAIDQQQYLQGYLPIVFLNLYNNNLNTVGGGQPVLTGPGFVDASNAADVIELADAGTR
jgi:simple sugar transport system substrate-binding protein